MDDLPRQKLVELIANYGRDLHENPVRCRGLLRDVCGDHRREVNLLLTALQERIPAQLLGSGAGAPIEIVLGRLTTRLKDNAGLSDEAAAWAVESWALGLGLVTSQQLRQRKREHLVGNESAKKRARGAAGATGPARARDASLTVRPDATAKPLVSTQAPIISRKAPILPTPSPKPDTVAMFGALMTGMIPLAVAIVAIVLAVHYFSRQASPLVSKPRQSESNQSIAPTDQSGVYTPPQAVIGPAAGETGASPPPDTYDNPSGSAGDQAETGESVVRPQMPAPPAPVLGAH